MAKPLIEGLIGIGSLLGSTSPGPLLGKAHSFGLYLLHSSPTNMPSPWLDQSWGS